MIIIPKTHVVSETPVAVDILTNRLIDRQPKATETPVAVDRQPQIKVLNWTKSVRSQGLKEGDILKVQGYLSGEVSLGIALYYERGSAWLYYENPLEDGGMIASVDAFLSAEARESSGYNFLNTLMSMFENIDFIKLEVIGEISLISTTVRKYTNGQRAEKDVLFVRECSVEVLSY